MMRQTRRQAASHRRGIPLSLLLLIWGSTNICHARRDAKRSTRLDAVLPPTKARLDNMAGAPVAPLNPPLLVNRRYWHQGGRRRVQPSIPAQVLEHEMQEEEVLPTTEQEQSIIADAPAPVINSVRQEDSTIMSDEAEAADVSLAEPATAAGAAIVDAASCDISTNNYSQQDQAMVPRGGRLQDQSLRLAALDHHEENKNAIAQPSSAVVTTRPPPPAPGTASILSEIMTLTKAIVGAGVLGLPAGLATFYTLSAMIVDDDHSGVSESIGEAVGETISSIVGSNSNNNNAPSLGRLIFGPTLLLIATIGSASACGFDCIASVCDATHASSYRQAWAQTVSASSSWIPALACLLVTTCTTVTCSMILKSTLGTPTFLAVTLLVLLPLCLQQSLKKLAPFSVIGTLGMLYTAMVMLVRFVTGAYTDTSKFDFVADIVDEAYRPALGSATGTAASTALQPANPWLGLLNIKKGAILISMLSTSFMAHYNAPKLYWELRQTSPERFRKVIIGGFGTAIVLMSTIALSGFLTFGSAASGMILNNYAPTDGLASLAKAAVTVAVIFTVPLAFVGVRDGVLDFCQVEPERRQGKVTLTATIGGLAFITTMALLLKDIRIVLALGGSTWGMCVIYLFPALMVIHGADLYPVLKPKVPMARVLGAVGLVVGTMGIYRTLTTLL